MFTPPRSTTPVVLGAVLVVALSASALAQEPKTAALAQALTQAMDAGKLTAIAAKDPVGQDMYVAAMYFSGSQLLVVRARYEPAVLMDLKLEKKDYQEIYIDLNSASVASTRVFIEDLGADGLKADHPDNVGFDSVEQGGKRTLFDDEWRKSQRISQEEYARLFSEAEALYGRLLQALTAQAKK